MNKLQRRVAAGLLAIGTAAGVPGSAQGLRGVRRIHRLQVWGFDDEETSALLGIPKGTVGSRVHRAKQTMRATGRHEPGRSHPSGGSLRAHGERRGEQADRVRPARRS